MTAKISSAKRFNILGVAVSALELGDAVEKVIGAALHRQRLGVSALAVHGIMVARRDPSFRFRLNRLDMLAPDGQPVRWTLNILHGAALGERVYGPDLMRNVCSRARDEGLPIFLFGSTSSTLEALEKNLARRFPGIIIAGTQPSRFRHTTESERAALVRQIRESDAALVFVGLGCPRQEIWVYENINELSMPVLSVGAAFDYIAGTKKEPPELVKRAGLQWAHRLIKEPRRLWRRYLLLNPLYLTMVCLQATGLCHFPVESGATRITAVRPG